MAHFITDATADSHGQFKKKAEAAGMTTLAFADKHEHSPGLLGEQARLAKELIGFASDPKHKHKSLADRLHPKKSS